ncbi:MAG: WG repeat-containing protein, partial [Candidatus Caldipriscus sp.]
VVKPVYDEIKWFSESFLMVKLKDKYGLIRRDNFREVVKPKYNNIEPLAKFGSLSFSFYFGVGCVEQKSESFFKVYIGNKVGLIDTTGKEVVPVKYEDVKVVLGEKTLVKFKEKEKWGIMDLSANVILPAKYDWVCYNEGKVIFAVLDNKPYAFDASGKEIQYEFESEKEEQSESYEFQYEVMSEEGDEYSEDYGDFSIVSRAGKKGVVSKDGKVIIPIAYDEIRYDERNEIFFIAKKEYKDKWRLEYKYKWGLANKKGKIFVPMKYDYLTTFCKGLIVVKSNDKFGLMDKTGKIIVYPKYDMLGLVEESNDERYRIIRISEGQGSFYNAFFAENRSLSVWSDYQIKYVEEYCRDLFLVGNNDKFGLIDEKGTEVLRTEFDEVAPYEDLILARKGDKWGIFDLKGKTILEIKYDWISFEDLKEGRDLVRVKENYEAGLVDRKGNIVIPPKYDDIKTVVGDKVVVQVGAYIGIVDINGREILPAEYEDFSVFNENLFLMSKDLKWGLFDTEKGKFVLPVKYDEINYDENMGLFFVERDGKEFYVKVFSDGKVIEYFDP